MIRRLIAAVLALLALVGGLMVALPRIHWRVWIPQMIVTEASWMPILAGVAAVILRPLRWANGLIALTGIVLATMPFRQINRAHRDMRDALAVGLPGDPLRRLPLLIANQLQPEPLSWPRLFQTKRDVSGVSVTRDVAFCERPERTLYLDVYQPERADAALRPTIIAIHGGSWRQGDKGVYFEAHHRLLAAQGYVVFDIQYRFSQEAVYPAQLDDVHAAMSWVADHAAEYGADPQRVALIGRSAGGFLALHAAYRAPAALRPRAVAAYYPPVDLRLWEPLDPRSVVVSLMGGLPRDMPEAYDDAAATAHVDADSPPTLLIHGSRDALVPLEHSEALVRRLNAAEVPHALLRVPWARHGFDGVINGPGSQLTQYHLDRFLAWALRVDD